MRVVPGNFRRLPERCQRLAQQIGTQDLDHGIDRPQLVPDQRAPVVAAQRAR